MPKYYGYAILCMLAIVLLVSTFIVFLSKSIVLQVKDVYLDDIGRATIEGLKDNYRNAYGMDEAQAKAIMDNPHNYKFVVYPIMYKNIFKDKGISYVNIYPIFSKEMNKNIVGRVQDDFAWSIAPLQEQINNERIIVKANGYKNEDFLKMTKDSKFLITFYTGEHFWNFKCKIIK